MSEHSMCYRFRSRLRRGGQTGRGKVFRWGARRWAALPRGGCAAPRAESRAGRRLRGGRDPRPWPWGVTGRVRTNACTFRVVGAEKLLLLVITPSE